MHIFWYLPTQGDERYLRTEIGQGERLEIGPNRRAGIGFVRQPQEASR